MYPLYTFLGSRGVFDGAKRMFLSFWHICFVHYVRTAVVPVSFVYPPPRSPTKRKRKQKGGGTGGVLIGCLR